MDIHLYNTLTRQKDVFEPIHKGKVGIYSCGPTVYRPVSIGNFRSYIFADILRRMFELNGYEVRHVMNITDVGHLTGDGSNGEDKLEREARELGKNAWEIAQMYTDDFVRDMKMLGLKTPAVMPKATEHIPQQIEMIQALEKNGYTYRISDGIYFDTSKLRDYGALAGQMLDEKEAGARVEVNDEKRNPYDFALWKFSAPEDGRQMEWDSPWGVGFPGWHIECSAMSETYLDSPFDVHTGGMDLIPVHHTNEIAQTEGARGHKLANVWMHNEFLLVNGGKMSKSLGNAFTITDIKTRGFDAMSYRYFVLGAHYRSPLNFTWQALEAAQNALDNVHDILRELPSSFDETVADKAAMLSFTEKLNNDLDTSKALALLHKLLASQLPADVKSATVAKMDTVLGLGLTAMIGKQLDIPEDIQALIDERQTAREQKNYEKADMLREKIDRLGYSVEDAKDGQRVRQKRVLTTQE